MAKYKLNFYHPTSNQLYREIEFDCIDSNDIERVLKVHKRNYNNLEITNTGINLKVLHTNLPNMKHICIPEYQTMTISKT